MRKLSFILGMLISLGVSADGCISKFSDEELLSEIIQGNEIYTPFILGSLVDEKNEPEMKYKYLNEKSLKQIKKSLILNTKMH